MISKDVVVLTVVAFRMWCYMTKPLIAIKAFLVAVGLLCLFPYLEAIDALAPAINILENIVFLILIFGTIGYGFYASFMAVNCRMAVDNDPLLYINKYGQDFLKVD